MNGGSNGSERIVGEEEGHGIIPWDVLMTVGGKKIVGELQAVTILLLLSQISYT